MLSINTNLSSLIAQSSMKQSTNKLNQAIERMTTGFKINHASDNAANYSISTNMTTKIGAYDVAEDNAAMGLDMLTTVSSTLDLMEEHYSRIRDLAEQASNGTYGAESLKAIQAEIDARLQEIERIKNVAEYNGIQILESDTAIIEEATNVPFLAEVERINEEEAIEQGYTVVNTAEELLQALNNNESICLMNDIDIAQESMVLCSNYLNATLEGNGYTINITRNSDITNSCFVIENIENVKIQNLNLNFSGSFDYGMAIFENTTGNVIIENCALTGNATIKYNYYSICNENSGNLTLKNSYNNIIPTSGDNSGIYYINNGAITTENYYYNSDNIGNSDQEGGITDTELNAILDTGYNSAVIRTTSDKIISLQVGINGDANSQISCSTSFSEKLPNINCISADTARDSLSVIDSILTKLNDKQVEIGAVQNRLESVLEEITIQRDNLVSSRSTIRDANIADVSSTYIQQQILQQASATLLATANQSPSIALQLI